MWLASGGRRVRGPGSGVVAPAGARGGGAERERPFPLGAHVHHQPTGHVTALRPYFGGRIRQALIEPLDDPVR